MKNKKNFQKYQNSFKKIYFKIKGIFPFQSKKEIDKFDNYFNSYQKQICNLNNNNDFFLFIKKFISGFKHSHLRLDGFPWQIYHPKNYKIELIEDKFYLFKNKKICDKLLKLIIETKLDFEKIRNKKIKSFSGFKIHEHQPR